MPNEESPRLHRTDVEAEPLAHHPRGTTARTFGSGSTRVTGISRQWQPTRAITDAGSAPQPGLTNTCHQTPVGCVAKRHIGDEGERRIDRSTRANEPYPSVACTPTLELWQVLNCISTTGPRPGAHKHGGHSNCCGGSRSARSLAFFWGASSCRSRGRSGKSSPWRWCWPRHSSLGRSTGTPRSDVVTGWDGSGCSFTCRWPSWRS